MANTNLGSIVYFSPTPRPSTMDESEFEAISDWEDIGCVGDVGEIGGAAEFSTYNCWSGGVVKGPAPTDPGEVTFEMMWDPDNDGQVAMRDAAQDGHNYAMMIEFSNKPDADGTGTIIYLRGQLNGWVIPNGAAEDFQLRQVTLGLNQRHIEVDPQEGP